MDALAYFAGCAAIFAATLAARFTLARTILRNIDQEHDQP
jgi:hypothetical protein